MADYTKAFKITIIGNEGGYNPGIGEKETYMGIDRGANPHWPGWLIIDGIKAKNKGVTPHQMNSVLSQNPAFQADIARFFKSDYWDPLKLDQVSDQQIANNLFDCSVNQGEGLARLFMQRAANFVIDDKKLVYPLLKVDGAIGPETLKRIGQLCHDAPAALMQNINVKREASYRSDKQWLQWGKVWVARLVPYK